MQTQIISPDAIIDIQISASFHKRLQDLLLWLVSLQSPDEIQRANAKITQNQELEEWEHHYYSMLILIHDIEEAANSQQQVQMANLPSGFDE